MVHIRSENVALAAGMLYVGAIFFQEPILTHALGVPRVVSADYLLEHSAWHASALVLVRIPSLLVLVWATLWLQDRDLRRSLRPVRLHWLGGVVAATVLCSALLNALDVWPFMWRWAGDTSAEYARILVGSGRWLTLGIWAALGIVVAPFVEEAVFRFGILRLILRHTHSAWLAILGSSLLFALGHLGYWPIGRSDLQHLVNSAWLFAFSLLLGWLTICGRGNIMAAVAVHSARNALELGLLLVALSPHAG